MRVFRCLHIAILSILLGSAAMLCAQDEKPQDDHPAKPEETKPAPKAEEAKPAQPAWRNPQSRNSRTRKNRRKTNPAIRPCRRGRITPASPPQTCRDKIVPSRRMQLPPVAVAIFLTTNSAPTSAAATPSGQTRSSFPVGLNFNMEVILLNWSMRGPRAGPTPMTATSTTSMGSTSFSICSTQVFASLFSL